MLFSCSEYLKSFQTSFIYFAEARKKLACRPNGSIRNFRSAWATSTFLLRHGSCLGSGCCLRLQACLLSPPQSTFSFSRRWFCLLFTGWLRLSTTGKHTRFGPRPSFIFCHCFFCCISPEILACEFKIKPLQQSIYR